MSLVGKLEDLGLGEILQIVALSGKSGILHIHSRGRNGKIFFHKGKVVNAYSDSYRISLGEYLVRKGYVKQDIINQALAYQKQNHFQEKLGTILIKHFNIDREKIEESVIELIEQTVFSLFYWTEGDFKFELTDEIKNDDITLDMLQFDLSQIKGLNPQFLAMEGSRILDESRKEGLEDYVESAPTAEEKKEKTPVVDISPPKERPLLFFYDDYPLIRNVFSSYFQKRGYNVITKESLEEAKEELKMLINRGERFILVTSLIAEKPDGSGILGGLELVNIIPKNGVIPVFVSCDYPIPDAEELLKEWKAVLIKKPKRYQLTKENIEKEIKLFLETLANHLMDLSEERGENKDGQPTPWINDIKKEFNIGDSDSIITTTPGLKLLKSMVAELSNAASGNEIILMILRLASEIMPRAVLFAIKNNRLHGLGQFGLEAFLKEPFKTVKNLVLPIKGKIEEVIKTNMVYKGPPPEDENLSLIYQELGGDKPNEIFLATIYANNKPLVLFYGDDLPHKSYIQDTDALEIFFTQAGLAMERLLLEKK